jgi:hypothetical protein
MRTQIVSKDQIGTLFATLRKQGFLARQSFMCCMGCACAALPDLPKFQGAKGVVYYHKQDAEVWEGRGKDLYIRYGAAMLDENPGLTQAVGAEIVKTAMALGIKTTWNGKADECITIQVWS